MADGNSSTIDFMNVTGAQNKTTTDRPEQWQILTLAILFSVFIIITVVGNTLVILAVITTRRLRTVTNCYVMSLAVADWLVGVFVMPPKVALLWMGSWELGQILCHIWISLDVLCCTASILSLCAISVDRYLAVTQPLVYSRRRRSKKLALIMILVVWVLAIAITCPPMFKWYYNTVSTDKKECKYNNDEGYVIFSAMGSFFIPLIVMVYVYARISCVVAKRHDKLGQVQNDSKKCHKLVGCHDESDCMDRVSFDAEDQVHPPAVKSTSLTSNEHGQYTATSQHKKSMRSHLPYYSQNNHSSSTELCHHHTRLSFYSGGGGNRPSRPESLVMDLGNTEHSYSLKHDSSSRVSSFRRESKTTQTLTIVVGGFVACWLPFFITYLLTPFLTIPDNLMATWIWLGWFNSAINPFIYAFYSVDFRTAFWRLTFRHCSNSQKSQQQFLTRNK